MVKKLWSVFANSKKNLNDCDEYNNNSIIIIVIKQKWKIFDVNENYVYLYLNK